MVLLATASNVLEHTTPAVLDAAVLATNHWLHFNYLNSNWWWNDFGTPRAVLKTLLLLGGGGGTAALPAVDALVQHPNTTGIVARCKYAYTGTNRVWAATVFMMRAMLLEPTPSVAVSNISYALAKIATTSTVGGQPEDGLMDDGSWHQHGPFLYSGWGYGAIWSQHMLFWGNLTTGLPLFELPDSVVAGVSAMLLDGQRWMSRGMNFDPATCGRLVTYFGNWSGPEHLNHGHYHYYAAFTAFSMAFPDFFYDGSGGGGGRSSTDALEPSTAASSVRRTPISIGFADYLNTPFTRTRTSRGREFADWQATIGNVTTDTLAGNRVFYDSDYVVHRRPHFSLTVRMSSTRTIQSECVNEEGKQNRYMVSARTTKRINNWLELRAAFWHARDSAFHYARGCCRNAPSHHPLQHRVLSGSVRSRWQPVCCHFVLVCCWHLCMLMRTARYL